MFCRNCGFEIKDQELKVCPECSCILSPEPSAYDTDEETEELFEDIDSILNSDKKDNSSPEEELEKQLEEQGEDESAFKN